MPKRDACNLRPMAETDLDLVLSWRNQERIRRAMYTDHVISLDEHRAWFKRVSEDKSRLHFVFECDCRPVGVVNVVDIDWTHSRCVWGFYIGDESAPRGAGTAMGYLALEFIFEKLGLHKVVGEALADNEASICYHERLGFARERCLVDHICKGRAFFDVITFGLLNSDWYKVKDQLAAQVFGESV
ncbi:MAG: UDP-4-amino-4,6-dideoxy-N-acetyl-beta-L-altrosamine N-acetyltransferase [Candidatus Zixiibacteriota bacterium]